MEMIDALTIEPDQAEVLKDIAARQFRSPEVLVREAIDEYIASATLTARDLMSAEDYAQMLADARKSSEHYKRTGLHLTHDEVADWVRRLHDDPHAQLPECHT